MGSEPSSAEPYASGGGGGGGGGDHTSEGDKPIVLKSGDRVSSKSELHERARVAPAGDVPTAPGKFDAAREAFQRRDVAATRFAHSYLSEEFQRDKRVYSGTALDALRDGVLLVCAVLGGLAGVAAASPEGELYASSSTLAAALGVALGLALASGAVEFTRRASEAAFLVREREREEWEVANALDLEKNEMVELYTTRGMRTRDARRVVDLMSLYPAFFVDVMMVEELGLVGDDSSPVLHGFVRAGALLAGLVAPVVWHLARAFVPGMGGSVALGLPSTGGVSATAVALALSLVMAAAVGSARAHMAGWRCAGQLVTCTALAWAVPYAACSLMLAR